MALRSAIGLAVLLAGLASAPLSGQVQPGFTTLYEFAGPPNDAYRPNGSLVFDAGRIIGTTTGGPTSVGTVFELTPPATPGGAWTEQILHSFACCGPDGSDPEYAGVVIGAGGVLYGTTAYGGTNGSGTVYSVTPPTTQGGSWTETVLYSFQSGSGGGQPFSTVAIGPDGSLYCTTPELGGGPYDLGKAIQIVPPSSPGGAWTGKVIHSFHGAPDGGADPGGGLAIDANGAIYGATSGGGVAGIGTVFQLTPPAPAGAPALAARVNESQEVAKGGSGGLPHKPGPRA